MSSAPPVLSCTEPGCDFVAKAPQGLGAHKRFSHGIRAERPQKAPRKRDKDIGDALIAEFRSLLKQSEALHSAIEKQREYTADLERALREANLEIKRLDHDNAELKAKVLRTFKRNEELRHEVRVVPLESRLTQQELAYLQRAREAAQV